MKLRRGLRLFSALVLVFCLLAGVPLMAWGGQDDVLAEIRQLLETEYVDEVSEDVLNCTTVEEMLSKLGDRHTEYLTKEDYDYFLDTLDRTFSGIGIELEMVPQGVLVLNVFEGYGASLAGIRPGDIITLAGGYSFAGKPSEYCISKLRGPEGSIINLQVKRGTQVLDLAVRRMIIGLPLVESELLEGSIGYISVYSFGQDTAEQFDKHARELKEKGADRWIIDLRNNGGGYTQAALDLLGFIIGEENAVLFKDKSVMSLMLTGTKQEYTLGSPVIVLTNGYTGSSSEIFTAAVKDHFKGTIIGDTTYGSGKVKSLMPLSNGDYLKMTIYRFFSPLNLPIDEVGIKPHINLKGVDELEAAVLLLKNYKLAAAGESGDMTGLLQLNAGPNDFVLSLEDMRKSEYWKLGMKILDSAYVTTTLKLGGTSGWEPFPEEYLNQRHKIYYPGYITAGNLPSIPLDKRFTVTFNRDMDWQSVSADNVELIDVTSGERIKCIYNFTSKQTMTVTPRDKLKQGTEYWLVIHPSVKTAEGAPVTGGVAVAKTVK